MISHPEKSKDHQETNCWPRRICTSSSQSESSNLSDNADKRCQPQWGRWRRRRREGSQRKKGQLRRDETHKGKEGRGKGFTVGKEQMTFKRVTEYGKWARRLKGLGRGDEQTLKTSLDVFSFTEMFSSRGPNNKNTKGKLHLPAENEGMFIPKLYWLILLLEPQIWWHIHLFPPQFDGTTICFHSY